MDILTAQAGVTKPPVATRTFTGKFVMSLATMRSIRFSRAIINENSLCDMTAEGAFFIFR
jgi:hypothetical protein